MAFLRIYTRRTGRPIPRWLRRYPWYFPVTHMFAKERYRPVRYPGEVTVFTLKGRFPDPTLGWTRWAETVSVIEVEGTFRQHRDLMGEPIVSAWAPELAARVSG
ncbi:MAG: hypothetical protein ACRENB_07475 [Gemmatimonadales bacterium]